MFLLAQGPSSSCAIFFLFFLKGSLWKLYIFPEGWFLSPPPPKEMWVTFLIWWVGGALLRDVLFGVTTEDWALFLPGTFHFCLYE
jgi:hypothetical protein